MSEPIYRILILGDFGARGHRGLSDAGTLKGRRARRVDRDDLDRAIASFAPEIHVGIEPGAPPVVVPIKTIEDFHPDRLLQTVAELRALLDMKASAGGQASRPSASPAAASPPESAAIDVASGSVLDLILDSDGTVDRPILAPRDELSKFIAGAVQKHVVAPPSSDQQALAEKINGVVAATTRVLLHHPQFQATEALWRATSFLARRVDTGEGLSIDIVDVSREELDLAATTPGGAAGRALLSLLRGEGPGAHGGWSLVIGAYSFAPADVATIAGVASLASEAGVPWVSAADSTFVGAASFGGNADPDDWDRAELAEWDAFRRTADARWLSLAIPRFLLRVPYGARTDECELMKFEETDNDALAHDQYLWGNAAFLVGIAFADAVANGDEIPTHGTVDGLPLFVGKVDGLPEVTPVAEAFLAGRAVALLLDRGFTAVASERDGDSIRLPRVQTVAEPHSPLPPAREQ